MQSTSTLERNAKSLQLVIIKTVTCQSIFEATLTITAYLSDHLCRRPSCVPLHWSYCATPPGYVHPVWRPSPAEPDRHQPTTACHLEKQMNYLFPKVTELVGLTANGGTCHYHLFVLFYSTRI